MEKKIPFKGQTKKGVKYLIRYPKVSDFQIMTDYINALSQEHTFIRFQGEKISIRDETKYLKEQLKKIKQKKEVQLLVFCDNKMIGISAINMNDKTESHEGVFGITLAKEYRGQGLGKILMDLVLTEAEKKMPQLRIITLGVFGDNSLAQALYKKFGFQEYGRLPEGILHKGKFVDHILMYKKVK